MMAEKATKCRASFNIPETGSVQCHVKGFHNCGNLFLYSPEPRKSDNTNVNACMSGLNLRGDGPVKYWIVWDVVRQVPTGKVSTYGEIARLCGFMRQARFVGQALHNLPPNSNVPWHRVINSQGRISFPRNQAGYRTQKKLLEKE